MPVQTPLLAVVPAFLIACAILVALYRPWLKGAAAPPWAGALALAAAFIAADCLVWRTWPVLWSVEEQRRLWLVAIGGVAAAALNGASKDKVVATWRAWLVGAALMAPILWVDISRPGTYPQSLLFWLMWSGAIALLWSENANTSGRVGGARVPLVLCLAAAGACLTILQSGTASIALTAAGVSAAMAAFAVFAWWRPGLRPVTGALPVFAALLVGLLVASTGTGIYPTVLTILSGATATLGDKGPLKRLPAWAGTAACAIATLALVAWSISLTKNGFDFSEAGPGGY